MHIIANSAIIAVTLGLIAASTVVAAGHNRRRILIPVPVKNK